MRKGGEATCRERQAMCIEGRAKEKWINCEGVLKGY